MTNEIKTLIIEYKRKDKEIEQRDNAIKKEEENIIQMQLELERRTNNIIKMTQENSRLNSQLRQKNIQLNTSRSKVKVLNNSVIVDFKTRLEECEKLIEALKETNRTNRIKIKIKNKEILNHKSKLDHIKSKKIKKIKIVKEGTLDRKSVV